jgi:hypothetical protein
MERAAYESELEPVCVANGLGVINYYALASGFLTGKYRSSADLGKSVRSGGAKKYLDDRGRRCWRARRGRRHGRRDARPGRAGVADRPAEHHRADRQREHAGAARRARRRGAAAPRHAVDRADRSRQPGRAGMTARDAGQGLSMTQVLLCGAAIVTLSMGIRHGFGLWLQPVTVERGWSRETFAFALAVQNLAWGIAGPLTGALADRFGAFRVLVAGGLLYALGLVAMGLASTARLPRRHRASCSAGAVGNDLRRRLRRDRPQRRAEKAQLGDGHHCRGGLVRPVPDGADRGRPDRRVRLAGGARHPRLRVADDPAARLRPARAAARARPGGATQSMGAALREAFGDRSFLLLTAGYFVCGFQVVFIGVHLPSYLKDHGLTPGVATTALALIGLFNVFGTYTAGDARRPAAEELPALGHLHAALVAIVAFVLAPLTPASVYVFACAMGFLWLSTVPLTSGLVAQIYGVRYCRCSAASSSSATRSAASSASGSAGASTT